MTTAQAMMTHQPVCCHMATAQAQQQQLVVVAGWVAMVPPLAATHWKGRAALCLVKTQGSSLQGAYCSLSDQPTPGTLCPRGAAQAWQQQLVVVGGGLGGYGTTAGSNSLGGKGSIVPSEDSGF